MHFVIYCLLSLIKHTRTSIQKSFINLVWRKNMTQISPLSVCVVLVIFLAPHKLLVTEPMRRLWLWVTADCEKSDRMLLHDWTSGVPRTPQPPGGRSVLHSVDVRSGFAYGDKIEILCVFFTSNRTMERRLPERGPRLKAEWLRLQTAAGYAKPKQEAGWKVTLPLSSFIMVSWHWERWCSHEIQLDLIFGVNRSMCFGSYVVEVLSLHPLSFPSLLVGDECVARFAASPPRLLRVCFVSLRFCENSSKVQTLPCLRTCGIDRVMEWVWRSDDLLPQVRMACSHA